jgi:hypothetical protein
MIIWPSVPRAFITTTKRIHEGEIMDYTQQIFLFPEESKWLQNLRIGDPVERWLGGAPIKLLVTDIKEDLIVCGGRWEFLRENGAEYDPELGWGLASGAAMVTGSYIRPPAQ